MNLTKKRLFSFFQPISLYINVAGNEIFTQEPKGNSPISFLCTSTSRVTKKNIKFYFNLRCRNCLLCLHVLKCFLFLKYLLTFYIHFRCDKHFTFILDVINPTCKKSLLMLETSVWYVVFTEWVAILYRVYRHKAKQSVFIPTQNRYEFCKWLLKCLYLYNTEKDVPTWLFEDRD